MRPNEPKGERKNMKMTFRWYGSQSDKITLKQIKQIPGCTGLMGVLDYKAAGEVWEEDEIKAYIDEVHAAGLECEVIESVNVPVQIRHGTPDARLLAEITFAGGFTSYEGGGISYNLPYCKNVPMERTITDCQYVDRLTGL